jgi:hypothetical protein
LSLCRQFMIDVVANLDNYWELTSDDIDRALSHMISPAARP